MPVINHLYSHGDNIELDCELDYSPAESDWPAQAILMRAMVGGVDVVPLLSDNLIAQIEEAAVWSRC